MLAMVLEALAFGGVIVGSMEVFLSRLLNLAVGRWLGRPGATSLPYNPKQHLDKFEDRDSLYIGINKGLTVVFVYHLCWVVWRLESVSWSLSDLRWSNTLGSLLAFFASYDLFYASCTLSIDMSNCTS